MKVKNALLVLALFTALCGSTFAASIPVTNPSFEAQALGDGGFTVNDITAWTVTTVPGVSNAGVFDPAGNPFSLGGPGFPSGDNVLFLQNANVSQTLSSALMPGTYTLTVDVGHRSGGPWNPNYSVSLLAGSAVLASIVSTGASPIDPGNGRYMPLTLNYTASVSDANVGLALGIRFSNNNPQTNFDNVALSVTAIPEPESYAMLLAGLGLLGVVALRRKQKLID